MSTISIRVNESEKLLIEEFASFHGEGVSSFIKSTLFKAIEDEYDIKKADEAYSEHLKIGKTYSLKEMRERYDL